MSGIEISSELRNSAPYSRIGLLVATWFDNTQTCGTFSVVGRNDVLTATHLVFDPNKGGKPKSVELYLHADYNQNSSRFDDAGVRIAVDLNNIQYQGETFSEGSNNTLTMYESSYDLAVIGLTDAIGDTYGYFSLNPLFSDLNNQMVSAVGYPAGSNGMMSLTVKPQLASYFNWQTLSPDLKPGNSGGPLLIGNNLIGVASAASDEQSVWAGLKASFEFITTQIAINDILLGASNGDSITYDYRDAATDQNQTLEGYNLDERFAGGAGNDIIYALGGNDELDGGLGDDKLYGGDGSDLLIGGLGVDVIYGGVGNDVYHVDNAKDKVYELKNEGIDTVVSSITFTLGTNLEKLILSGSGQINGTGNTLDNTLTGNIANNKLSGGAGNDSLDGSLGNDTLIGGTGKDTLVGDLGADVLTGGLGADVFVFSASDSLPTSNVLDQITDFSFKEGDQLLIAGLSSFNCHVKDYAEKTYALALLDATKDFTQDHKNVSIHFVGSNALLFADTNGDGSADIAVTLTGLKAGDAALTNYFESSHAFIQPLG